MDRQTLVVGTWNGSGRADFDVCGKCHAFRRQLTVLAMHNFVVTVDAIVVRQNSSSNTNVAAIIPASNDGIGTLLVGVIFNIVNRSNPLALKGAPNTQISDYIANNYIWNNYSSIALDQQAVASRTP